MRKIILILFLLSSFDCLYPQWISNYGEEGDAPRTVSRYNGMDVATSSTGSCFVAGYTYNSTSGNDLILIKYNVNGKLAFLRVVDGNAHGDDKAFGIVVDEDGATYTIGQIENVGTYTDLVLLKYDNSGNLIWTRTYSATSNGKVDKGIAITLDVQGNIVVTGYCTGDDGKCDILVQKYSPAGECIWTKRIDGDGTLDCQASDLAIGGNGNIYVTGYTTYVRSNIKADIITCSISPSGNLNWTRIYNGQNFEDKAFGIAIDEADNVYVTGYTTISQDTSNTSALLIKLSPGGSQLWTKLIESGIGGSSDKAWGIVIDDDKIFVIGQYFTSPGSVLDYLIARYDQSGNNIWFRTYNGVGSGEDVATDVALLKNGKLVVTGYSMGYTNFDYCSVILNSSNGLIHKELRYSMSSNSNDYALSIVASKNNDFYVTGYSEYSVSWNSDIYSSVSTLMYPDVSEENVIVNSPGKFNLYQNYPNPFNPSTTIKFDISEKSAVKLEVFDLLGKIVDVIVDKELEAGSYNFAYKNSNLASGIYFYKLTAGNFSEIKKMSFIK